MTNEVNEMSAGSRGSHGDTLSVLRTLIDGVRGMGLGDPDSGGRVEASDVVRWAVDEIARLRGSLQWLHVLLAEAEERLANLRLTDEEREAIRRLSPSGDPLASLTVTLTPGDRKVFHGLLERTAK